MKCPMAPGILVSVAAVLVFAASGWADTYGPGHVITTPYNGADLLPLTTTAPTTNWHCQPYPTPFPTAWPNGEVSYNNFGEKWTNVGAWDGSNFLGMINAGNGTWYGGNGHNTYWSSQGGFHTSPNSYTAVMDTQFADFTTGAYNPSWFDAHFTTPQVISHFVLQSAGYASQPDQFQIRGSNDGTNWTVIYRYDRAAVGGDPLWGTLPAGSNVALQFDAGTDFAVPAAYSQIRLELYRTYASDVCALYEWQLAGSALATWPNYLPGDFNKDGQVGPEDFGILKDTFGTSNLAHGNHESWTLGDANDDGQIGPEDFGLLKDSFGLSNGPTGTYPLANVPEPATAAVLALAGLAFRRKQR